MLLLILLLVFPSGWCIKTITVTPDQTLQDVKTVIDAESDNLLVLFPPKNYSECFDADSGEAFDAFNKNVTLRGSGQHMTIVKCENFGYFGCSGCSNVGRSGALIVEDMTFINNQGNAGGVIDSHTHLVVRRCTFDKNIGSTGMIKMYSGVLVVEDCTFSNNLAFSDYGGALALYGDEGDTRATVRSSTFINNKASTAGGAIYSLFVPLSVYNSVFEANDGKSAGGAIKVDNLEIDGGTLLVDRCIFNNNIANSGGAVFVHGSRAIITDSLFFKNTAVMEGAGAHGGAVYGEEGGTRERADPSAVALTNVTMEGNQASNDGGAVALDTQSTLDVDLCFMKNNTALLGGAIATRGVFSVARTTFDSNSAREGGAVWVLAPSGNISHSSFVANSAAHLGMSLSITMAEHEVVLSSSSFAAIPSGTQYCGDVFASEGKLLAINVTVGTRVLPICEKCHPTFQTPYMSTVSTAIDSVLDGQEISLDGRTYSACYNGVDLLGKAITISGVAPGSTVIDCRSAGRAFQISTPDSGGEGAASLRSLSIINAKFGGNGGAIVVRANAILTLTSVVVRGCRAQEGAAVFAEGNTTVLVAHCLFANNSAYDLGGALASTSGTLRLNDTLVEQCSASWGGGAVFVRANITLDVHNCQFDSNSASVGGAIFAHNTSMAITLVSSSFSSNFAVGNGGAVVIPTVVKCEDLSFIENEARISGGGMYWTSTAVDCGSHFYRNKASCGANQSAALSSYLVAHVSGQGQMPVLGDQFDISVSIFDFFGNLMACELMPRDSGALYGGGPALVPPSANVLQVFSNGSAAFTQVELLGHERNSYNLRFLVPTHNALEVSVAIELQPCRPMHYLVTGHDFDRCVRCNAGTYSLEPGSSKCQTCPTAQSCVQTSQTERVAIIQEGYFLLPSPTNPSSVASCRVPEACPEKTCEQVCDRGECTVSCRVSACDNPPCFVCSDGYTGRLCARCYCIPGGPCYHQNGRQCVPCPPRHVVWYWVLATATFACATCSVAIYRRYFVFPAIAANGPQLLRSETTTGEGKARCGECLPLLAMLLFGPDRLIHYCVLFFTEAFVLAVMIATGLLPFDPRSASIVTVCVCAFIFLCAKLEGVKKIGTNNVVRALVVVRMRTVQGFIKSLLVLLQTTDVLFSATTRLWPLELIDLAYKLESTNLSTNGLECVNAGLFSYFGASLALILFPLMFFLFAGAGCVVLVRIAKCVDEDKCPPIVRAFEKGCVMMFYVAVFPVFRKIFAMFNCENGFVAEAPWLSCSDPTYEVLVAVSGAFSGVYLLTCFAIMYKLRASRDTPVNGEAWTCKCCAVVNTDNNVSSACSMCALPRQVPIAYAFLVVSYKEQYWWFEGVVLTRRLLLAATVALIPTESPLLPLGVFGILLIAFFVQTNFAPHVETANNVMEVLSIATVFMTFAGAVCASLPSLVEHEHHDAVVFLLVTWNIVVLAVFMIVIIMAVVAAWQKTSPFSSVSLQKPLIQ